jgi:hypothetical protein
MRLPSEGSLQPMGADSLRGHRSMTPIREDANQ